MYRILNSKESSAFSVHTSTGGLGLARSAVTNDTALGWDSAGLRADPGFCVTHRERGHQ
jgi:hypothetical protein